MEFWLTPAFTCDGTHLSGSQSSESGRVLRLDDSRHVVAGVVSVAATPAEEQDARDQCEDDTSNADKERPVEHHFLVVKANIMILVHETAIHGNANSNADS